MKFVNSNRRQKYFELRRQREDLERLRELNNLVRMRENTKLNEVCIFYTAQYLPLCLQRRTFCLLVVLVLVFGSCCVRTDNIPCWIVIATNAFRCWIPPY